MDGDKDDDRDGARAGAGDIDDDRADDDDGTDDDRDGDDRESDDGEDDVEKNRRFGIFGRSKKENEKNDVK